MSKKTYSRFILFVIHMETGNILNQEVLLILINGEMLEKESEVPLNYPFRVEISLSALLRRQKVLKLLHTPDTSP